MKNTPSTNKEILFLDIDGVVNCATTTQRSRGYIGIDPEMAFLVGKIQLDTGCRVVLSSSWRGSVEGEKEIKEQVVNFIDKTPNTRRYPDRLLRGYEIQDWLNAHPEVTKYAIIDDDSDMLPEQLPNFFQTSWKTGITKEIADKIIEHLS